VNERAASNCAGPLKSTGSSLPGWRQWLALEQLETSQTLHSPLSPVLCARLRPRGIACGGKNIQVVARYWNGGPQPRPAH